MVSVCELDSSGSEWGLQEGSYNHDNELSCSVKDEEFLD